MTTPAMEVALRKLGYRRMKPTVTIWGKPVGYHLFTVSKHGELWRFDNHFKGANGKLLVYGGTTVADEMEIKTAETDTKLLHCGWSSDFGFVTPEEVYASLL